MDILNHDARPFIAISPAMQPVLVDMEQVAATDASVLILGENGTGKNLSIPKQIMQKSKKVTSAYDQNREREVYSH